jgi:hypothetical protein
LEEPRGLCGADSGGIFRLVVFLSSFFVELNAFTSSFSVRFVSIFCHQYIPSPTGHRPATAPSVAASCSWTTSRSAGSSCSLAAGSAGRTDAITFLDIWLLAVGCWFLAVGSWLLALGSWFLVIGSYFLNKKVYTSTHPLNSTSFQPHLKRLSEGKKAWANKI